MATRDELPSPWVRPFADAHGTTYMPWTNGYSVGFRCVDARDRVSYIYLNPSSEDSDGKSNVFVYQGVEGEPGQDSPMHYYSIEDAFEKETVVFEEERR